MQNAPVCYVFVKGNAPGKRIGIVKFRESGYYVTDYDRESVSEAIVESTVAILNHRLGISKDVEDAMYAGSMFGWDVPAAAAARKHAAAMQEAS